MNRSFPLPWRDKRGRFVPIKALALALLTLPAIFLALDAYNGLLGPRPWNQAIHVSGLWAERLLLVTLALTPLRVLLDWPRLAFIRRICGIGALSYVALHLTLYGFDMKFHWAQMAWEVFTRFYLIIGLIAVCGLLALGVTSTDAAMRRMGARWKRLHRLLYAIAAITTVHYLLQVKADISGPVLAFGVLAWLLLWRLLPARAARHPLALLGLGAIAALVTAGAEAAWYGLATGINWRLVLAANIDAWSMPRPAGEAVLMAAALVALVLLRRHLPPLLSRASWPRPPLPGRAPSR